MKRLLLTLCVFILLAPQAYAQDFKTEIKKAETLGRIVYEHDRAAWVATDELLADGDTFERLKTELGGWINVEDGKNYRTLFLSKSESEPRVLYEVSTKKGKVKSQRLHDPVRPLSKSERRIWAAQNLMLTQQFEYCEKYTPMNTLTFAIPDDPQNRIYSYLFSATKKPNEIVLGKHFRYLISADTKSVLETQAFSNSCYAIAKPPAGTNAIGAVTSHIVTNYPMEHHVFASLSHNLDLYVTIPETGDLWKIRKGKISKVKTKK